MPVVDFGKFWTGSKADRLAISKGVVKAFKEIGFMYISNHNIEQGVIDNAFKQVLSFVGIIEAGQSDLLSIEFRLLRPARYYQRRTCVER